MKSKVITPEMQALLRLAGSKDPEVARANTRELAVALTLPLRQGVLNGDIVGPVFEPMDFQPGMATEFPLDLLAPGTEKDHVAYTIPSVGRLAERTVEGDYVMVPTYDVGNSIDWNLKYARDARWDVVGRAMQVLEAGFVRKMNSDAWHVLLAAGKGRNLVVHDDAATTGLFTKRVISLAKVIMRRNSGGNSTSLNRGKLTDLYLSPESIEDIRSWDLTQVDDLTRREIMMSNQDTVLNMVYGVRLHDLDEFGVGQEFQTYYEEDLGGSMPGSKTEILVGLDLLNRDSFVMPVREKLQIFEDLSMHRQRRAGLYGTQEHGFGCLDVRRTLLLAV